LLETRGKKTKRKKEEEEVGGNILKNRTRKTKCISKENPKGVA
jgi:hypothetical protein